MISIVIPSFKVKKQILEVLSSIGPEVSKIFVIDDCCPEGSGKFVLENCKDQRVEVIFHDENLGVGGAVITGFHRAIEAGADVIVKIDGDGQMNPTLISKFTAPILSGKADYAKGNRFFNIEDVVAMPPTRIFGNVLLSFITKLSSGYWDIFDPTNGYVAISAKVANVLPLKKISKRYFFESDMLFRLNTVRAVVVDIPMRAMYADEVSNLKISKILGEFLFSNLRNFLKRIFYNYYLRDMSIASLELPVGLVLFNFGIVFGVIKWYESMQANASATPAGTVMLAALPVLMGLQFLLSFISYDIQSVPKSSLHSEL